MNSHEQPSRKLSAMSRIRGAFALTARRVAAAAGAPAGLLRQSRRGSFLVLVVGTLALMSVFAIVYIAIGRADAGLSVGVRRNAARDDAAKEFAEYVSQIIADDVLSTTAEIDSTAGTTLAIRREAIDYPSTIWELRSDVLPTDPLSFSPVGTYRNRWTTTAIDPRGPSDPWLASSEPTFLNWAGVPANAVPLLDFKDWAHISNVAPDGRFVNLANLRTGPSASGPAFFGFGASYINMRVMGPGADGPLNLDDGSAISTTDFGTTILPAQPAYLTDRQRGAFRPARPRAGDQPNQRSYLPYMWADADGDGMFDSRWIEMVDAHDTQNVKHLFDLNPKYRYFFATRIVDLSSMVNVTTGLDLAAAPSDTNRVGMSPGEVDLRRLLTLEDVYTAIAPVGSQGGYQLLQQPPGNDTGINAPANNYTNYNQGNADGVGRWAYNAMYAPGVGAMNTGLVPRGPTGPTVGNGFFFANAISRLQKYVELGGGGTGSAFGAQNDTYTLSTLFGPDTLAELLTYRGVNDSGITSPLETILGGRYVAPVLPNTRRYSPMRENRGLELERPDPSTMTPQEIMAWSFADVRQRLTTISGARATKSSVIVRIPANNPAAADLAKLDTLEHNAPGATLRDLSSELKISPVGIADDNYNGTTDSTDYNGTLNTTGQFPENFTVPDPKRLFKGYCDSIIPDSYRLNGSGAPRNAWPSAGGAAEFDRVKYAHYGYSSPEMGLVMAAHLTANLVDAVDMDPTVNQVGAANPIEDKEPSVFTVLIDESFRATLGSSTAIDEWWWGDPADDEHTTDDDKYPHRLDLNARLLEGDKPTSLAIYDDTQPTDQRERRLGDAGDTLARRAVNVYGIEAQPVLTAAASYYMYTDASEANGGDSDYGPDTDSDGQPDSGWATINGDVSPGQFNTDYLMQAVAFQLNNPFDKAINLTADPKMPSASSDEKFLYYIEFNGRYFRLAERNPAAGGGLSDVTIDAGMSRVFYVLCASPEFIQNRWSTHDTNIPSSGVQKVVDWANTQFSGAGFQAPVLLEEFSPINAARDPNSLYTGTMTDLVGVAGSAAHATNKQVRLWRALRSKNEQTSATSQVVQNDLLVDRLRDPVDPAMAVKPTLDAQITDASGKIDGTDVPNVHDQGLSITTWGLIRRSGEPGATAIRGAFPAYMIETGQFDPNRAWDAANTSKTNFEEHGPTGIDLGDVKYSDFGGGTSGHESFMGLIDYQTTSGNSPLIPEMSKEPAKFNALNKNIVNEDFANLRAEILEGIKLNGDLTKTNLRVGDLLLPLAVGPEYANTTLHPAWTPDNYITLGESLALALFYDNPVNPADTAYAPLYTDFGNSFLSDGAKLDHGCLSLTRFVPFFDLNSSTTYEPANDQLRGAGIPLALNVFENFSGLTSNYLSLTRPVLGQVNIATASLPVLRCLPMLSPASTPTWWGTAAHNVQSDVAATLLGYRDKASVSVRTVSTAYTGGLVDMFRDTAGVLPIDHTLVDGRYLGSQIVGLRERPGFESVGEVMLARVIDGTAMNTTYPCNVDHLGFNNANDSFAGIDSIRHSGTTGTPMIDPYAERLAVANGVMNSIAVRSDYFACWFVVQGYQQSDTVKDGNQPLTAIDPLVPSIQRRFLMVVDRSEVTKKGQKPRIVLFKEVPM